MPRHEHVLIMILISVLLTGCLGLFESNDKPSGSKAPKIYIMNNDSNYVGVPLGFRAVFSQPADDFNQLSWKTGSGKIISQSSGKGDVNIKSDTVYLEWNSLPKSTVLEAQSNKPVYLDTISVTANGLVSQKIVVNIINIFPDVTITVNGYTTTPKGDSIFVRVHRGSLLDISLSYNDILSPTPYTVDWPDFMKINGDNPDPIVDPRRDKQTFDFGEAPDGIFDKSGILTITDGYGASQQWTLRYQTYQERGSIWVGSRDELIKLSGDGLEIFRDSINLPNTIIMDIFGNDLYVVNYTGYAVDKYNTLDFTKSSDKVQLRSSEAILDLEAVYRYVWVAYDTGDSSVIVQYEPAPQSGAFARYTISGIPGSVRDMSAGRKSESLWFINSLEDRVYFSVEDSIHLQIDNEITDPRYVSYDPFVDFCWVANKSTLIMLDSDGNKWGSIGGFGNIVSISAGLGFCMVVDHHARKVYSFDHSITENRIIDVDELRPSEFSKEFDFPAAVSMVIQKERHSWVAEEGRGSVVKLDSTGKELHRFVGMLNPQKILVNTGN